MREPVALLNNFCDAAKTARDKQHRNSGFFEGSNQLFGPGVGLDVTVDEPIHDRGVGTCHQFYASSQTFCVISDFALHRKFGDVSDFFTFADERCHFIERFQV